jgi:hypothetical protein
LIALDLAGPRISRIGVFSLNDGAWYAEDLREPVEHASPLLSSNLVAYNLGRFVYAFSPGSKRWGVLDLSEGTRAEFTPVYFTPTPSGTTWTVPITLGFSPESGILKLSGPKVERVAVFCNDGSWYPQELRERVELASPIFSGGSVAYSLGRYVYAFAPGPKRWGVLELPAASEPKTFADGYSIVVEHDSHFYVFAPESGTWKDIDTRSTPSKP